TGHASTWYCSTVGDSGPWLCFRCFWCWRGRSFCRLPCPSPPRTATIAADVYHQPSAGDAGVRPGCVKRRSWRQCRRRE
ncbi:unnamed protein product, partial [Ectocarpus sp. 4 AP-2014]